MTTTENDTIALHYQGYEFEYDPSADVLTATKHGVTRQVGRGLRKALQNKAHFSVALEGLLRRPIWGETHSQHLPQLCGCIFNDVLKTAKTKATAAEDAALELELYGVR